MTENEAELGVETETRHYVESVFEAEAEELRPVDLPPLWISVAGAFQSYGSKD